ncbi:MAG TPA: DUF2723 domain-containing protein [Anaerolineae bacterium]|nr:DUF2723 domain-containing protein [Anaerolineae bacterium]
MSKRFETIDYGLALLLAGVAFLFYDVTLTPSLSYLSPDGNELATIPYVLGLAHMPGYPLYTWLGKIFTWLPFGDVAHRVNLMSAALGAAGVGSLYLIIKALLHPKTASPIIHRAGASLAATLFAFSPTFWSQAVIAEVYAPNIALVALTILALLHWERTRRDRDFFLFALIFGLSMGTHISNLGFAPAFALFVLLTDRTVLKRPTWWMAGIVGFSLGAAQFAWLPLKASTLNDRIMLEHAPTTLKGIYNYTLGAFPQFKFAFTLSELPDRVVVYLYLLTHQFGRLSLLVGVIGLAALLLRRSRHYYLLVGMYLVHIWFFIQYRAFDLDVFFLPAHFLWAIFLAFGIVELLGRLERITPRVTGGRPSRPSQWAIAIVTVSLALISLSGNLSTSDRSYDVSINDFYANVWEMLPSDSALLTQGGVFGYDAFYWQLVYDTRQDVLLPALPTPNPSLMDVLGRALYSTTQVIGPNRTRGPGGLPPNLVPNDLWQIPILTGAQSGTGSINPRGRLVLFQLSEIPKNLVIDEANPTIPLDLDMNDLTLLGADVDPLKVESGSRFHLTLYWRLDQPRPYQIETALDGRPIEIHDLGFGNLERYQAEVGPVLERVILEDYWLVVPSTIPEGTHELTVRIVGHEETITITELTVVDQEEAMERWLRIAGKSSSAP